uniref:Uncharacterized protein n=1 Tax=Lygus hesperus TaxID=30085 RepID=A0A146LUV7_LYGHE
MNSSTPIVLSALPPAHPPPQLYSATFAEVDAHIPAFCSGCNLQPFSYTAPPPSYLCVLCLHHRRLRFHLPSPSPLSPLHPPANETFRPTSTHRIWHQILSIYSPVYGGMSAP